MPSGLTLGLFRTDLATDLATEFPTDLIRRRPPEYPTEHAFIQWPWEDFAEPNRSLIAMEAYALFFSAKLQSLPVDTLYRPSADHAIRQCGG